LELANFRFADVQILNVQMKAAITTPPNSSIYTSAHLKFAHL